MIMMFVHYKKVYKAGNRRQKEERKKELTILEDDDEDDYDDDAFINKFCLDRYELCNKFSLLLCCLNFFKRLKSFTIYTKY